MRLERQAHFAGERDEMVLAQTGDLNIPDKNHFIVIFGKHSIVDDVYPR
jgi:hypothetical protein